MMSVPSSKYVVAWGEGIIHHYVLDVLKRRRMRSPGDEYSVYQEDGFNKKLTQVPEVGMGHPSRDFNHKPTPGDPAEPSSGDKADAEIYGADAPPDDEDRPGGGRQISPRGEPSVTTHQSIGLMSDDPVEINRLFDSNRDLDRKPYHRTRKLLDTLYNRKPVQFNR